MPPNTNTFPPMLSIHHPNFFNKQPNNIEVAPMVGRGGEKQEEEVDAAVSTEVLPCHGHQNRDMSTNSSHNSRTSNHANTMEKKTKAKITKELTEIYSEMRTRQRSAILAAGKMRSDPFFPRPSSFASRMEKEKGEEDVDSRRCLAVSSIIDDSVECHWSENYWRLQEELSTELSGEGLQYSHQCYEGTSLEKNDDDEQIPMNQDNKGEGGKTPSFPSMTTTAMGRGQLHWTVMQLVGFPDYDRECLSNNDEQENPYTTSEYLDCVQDYLTVCGMSSAITVTFVGVIAVSTGLLMIGIPSLDVNEARDGLRDALAKRGLPLHEPFVNNIVHSTIFRVTGDDDNGTMDRDNLHGRVLHIAKDYENAYLGKVILKNFQIGPASWRMLPTELQHTPPFRRWTLPIKTPSEQYDDKVSEDRACYTVSGASGMNLAKEIKLVLSRTESNITTTTEGDANNTSMEKDDASSSSSSSSYLETTIFTEEGTEEASSNDLREGCRSECLDILQYNFVEQSLEESLAYNEMKDTANGEDGVVADHSISNAATISGAGGLILAQELRSKLKNEKMLLDSLYYTDFY